MLKNLVDAHDKDIYYNIGGIFPLTGYLSWLGIYKKKGCELKIKIINSSGGINNRKLRLITYDDCSSEERARKAAEALVLKHGVIAMVGTASLPVSLTVANTANKYRTPVFLSSGYVIDPMRDIFVFNTAHRTQLALLKAFQYFSERGIEKIGLFMPSSPLGETGSWLARILVSYFNIKIVGEERFDLVSQDLITQLKKLMSLKPQAIFSFVTGKPAVWVATSMARIGFNVPLLLSHGNATPSFLRMVSHMPLNVIVPSGKTMVLDVISPDDPCKKIAADFSKIHLEEFGEPANYHSAELADALDLISEGLKQGASTPEELRDAVEGLKGFVGMQGIYDFSPFDHYGTQPEDVILLGIENTKWVLKNVSTVLENFKNLYPIGLASKLSGILLAPLSKMSTNNKEIVTKSLIAKENNQELSIIGALMECKSDLVCAIKKEEELKTKKCIYDLLTLLLGLEDFESFKICILEIFFLVSDVIWEKSGKMNEIVETRHKFLKEWGKTIEKEGMCLLLIKTFHKLLDVAESARVKKSCLLTKVTSFLEKNYTDRIIVKRIAKEVGMSPSYLIHKMKKDYGTKITECINKVRIENAMELMKHTDFSIGKIAHEVGYNDHSYFTKVFKKYMGFTPKEYKRKRARVP